MFWTLVVVAIPSTYLLLQYLYPWLKYDLKELKFLVKSGVRLLGIRRNKTLMVEVFETEVDKHPNKTFVIFQDNNYSYEFMESQINRVAHLGQQLGLKQGDVVAVLMHNEPAFIWTSYGLQKIGVEPAFLNFNLRNKALLHCFTVSAAKVLIVGAADELIEAVKDIQDDLEALGVKVYVSGSPTTKLGNSVLMDELLAKCPTHRPDKKCRNQVQYGGPCCYIYTSGTTGLPKAAVVSHHKTHLGSIMMDTMGVNSDDIFYTPLPLYHSAAGLIALGTVVKNGGTLVLRSKFSASNFWEDCRRHDVTLIQYIGELARYLLARPPSDVDNSHKVRVAFGNGLRKDIWEEFQTRFNIPQIGEFYAATEGNGGFINHHNKMGSIGRASPFLRLLIPTHFIKYDFETAEPARGADGLCIPVKPNEPGLMVCRIDHNFQFNGYKGNKELTDKKIVTNVKKIGDTFFNSGDIMMCDEEHFVYFCDRIGDTFRWKGENVSTIEVSNVVSELDWVQDANVYGVEIQGQDGRAGMASITLKVGEQIDPHNLKELYHRCEDLLPTYARPRFLRFQQSMQMTTTFKQQKMDLVKEGFNPEMCKKDPLYCLDAAKKDFVPLDNNLYNNIIHGKMRL